jgi:hypothetical protein
VFAVIAICIVVYDRVIVTLGYCVGELDVEFVVVDSISGQPIPGARIEVESFDYFEPRKEPNKATLFVGNDGKVQHPFGETAYSCHESGLGISEWISVPEPSWRLKVCAPGYQEAAVSGREPAKPTSKPMRTGPRKVKLTKTIELHADRN